MTEIKLDAKLRTLTRLVVIGFASCFIIALTSLLITLNLRKHYVDSQSEDYAISGYHTMMNYNSNIGNVNMISYRRWIHT